MPVFEKRGTRPGFIQVNINLWIFLISALCITVGVAIFFGTRDPMHSHIEKRAIHILTYHYPKCRQHTVDQITFTKEGNRILTIDSCGSKDYYFFKNEGLEFTPQSPNYGRAFLSEKPGGGR